MRILFIGSSGDLSLLPLRYLLASEHQVCAVAVQSTNEVAVDPHFPIINEQPDSVATQARQAAVPVIDLSDRLTDVLAAMALTQPDLILVSCYGKKLPQAIIDLPAWGCFNLHPSYLPAYRGPVPVFWQLRAGLSELGISLHRLSAQLDAGPVVAQRRVVIPDGVTTAQAQSRLAEAGVECLPDFFRALASNSLHAVEQDESAMSYQGYPQADDFRVETHWSARRVFNFIAASQHWGQVYPCRIAATEYRLASVLAYSDVQLPEETCVIDGATIQIACQPGLLLARLASN